MINKSSLVYVLSFMAIISIVFGGGIAVVHYVTLDTMKKNEALLQSKRLASAFMVDVKGKSPAAYDAALQRSVAIAEVPGSESEVYRKIAPPDSGALGFVFSGIGFWDVIKGILVVSPDLSHIVNIEFLSQSETPGLGARIDEGWFKKQFQGLSIDWAAAPDKLIIIGQSPNPQAPNRVDAIAGATQTSMALMKSINIQLQRIKAAQPTEVSPLK